MRLPKNDDRWNGGSEPTARRRFLSDGLGALVAGLIVPPALRSLVSVRPVFAEETKDPGKSASGVLKTKLKVPAGKNVEIDPLFRPFLGEKLIYEVNFLWTVKAALITATLRQGKGEEIIAELDAVAQGVVGWATTTKRQTLQSRLVVREIDGHKRLIATTFSRTSIKADRERRSLHHFDYDKKRWHYRRYTNGKVDKKKNAKDSPRREVLRGLRRLRLQRARRNVRRFSAGPHGDDPHDSVQGHRQIHHPRGFERGDGEGKTLDGKHPGAAKLGIVQIHQKIFGLKTGEGRILTDAKYLPIAGKVKDVVSFGDVSTTLVKQTRLAPKT
ncbi:MAG: hypothetical protein M5R36_10390 [Deltaproteobacteria bacterium]|nr:hypothetical protein [Deltaproteobacteria bacterium]